MSVQQPDAPVYSIEFFPPKTDKGRENLRATLQQLAQLSPTFISVTFGAGGSTQQGTYNVVKDILAAGVDAAPHLSCVGQTKESVKQALLGYIELGVKRIVALRGDTPSGVGLAASGDFHYANQLVDYIRAESGDHFHIEVAAYPEIHPQARDVTTDLKNFKRKVDAGANSAITQYFFNADGYYRFIDEVQKLGIDIPIVPGIMPITNYKQLARFSDLCGAEMPRWIRKRLENYGDDVASIQAFGKEVVATLCEDLKRNGCAGFHFYCLNKAEPTTSLLRKIIE